MEFVTNILTFQIHFRKLRVETWGLESDAGRTFTHRHKTNDKRMERFFPILFTMFKFPLATPLVHHLGKTLLVKTQAHTDEDSLCNEQISKIYALYFATLIMMRFTVINFKKIALAHF